MRLKRIKLAGFKSFVDPTSIPFPDDMTAIVGPNGCGKSNVIDAVRWVLGESSAKNLRGDAMTDVIFNGSSARKPVSQCSVELVFDNSSGRLQGEYANYNELSVKRLVTRDGQSNYFLNASKCRRRDVTDLFLGTGLGPRSYAIIEQGMISRLIESKPQELRVFIEEAAGISKYKERRRETENRIRHTKENLERLDDVRSELGAQLDKLQRQATAAKRYTELKKSERQYKAELAALRWLKHSEHITALDKQLASQETELEAFIAQQRGDERGMTALREQHADLKQRASDVQQRYFVLGNDITRLEQHQLHARQRQQQIDQSLSELDNQTQQLQESYAEETQQIAQLQATLADAEPAAEALQAQRLQAQEALEDSEASAREEQRRWREQEQHFHQTKRDVQSRHSQIQATMDMQLRTQQRLSELRQELDELEHDQLAEQIASLAEQVSLASDTALRSKQALQEAKQTHQDAKAGLAQRQQSHLAQQRKVNEIAAQIAALEAMQQADDPTQGLRQWLNEREQSFKPLWEVLDIEPGWEDAVASVCHHWQHALVISGDTSRLGEMTEQGSVQVFLQSRFVSDKPPGTLAAKINTPAVPEHFIHILCSDDNAQALACQAQLQQGQSVVTPGGTWMGRDWLFTPATDNEQSVLARAASIARLKEQRSIVEAELAQTDQAEHIAQQHLESTDKALSAQLDDTHQAEQALTQVQNQHNLLVMQHQQSEQRQARIVQDIQRHELQLAEEAAQSEQLAEELEGFEQRLSELSEQQESIEQRREQHERDVQLQRQQLEQLQSRYHQHTLTVQTARSQLQGLEAALNKTRLQQQDVASRREALLEEQQQLLMPVEEQAETLAELLASRETVEQELRQVNDQLADVEQQLRDVEQGQQGINQRIQQMREAMESTRLESEGYRVRANAVLEQLDELQVSLKPLLEQLPEQADEDQWQQALEKTTAAISRLGAVNLAAVEEYDVQSERKQHLDAQNEDLCAALDTLETAIRKIDRETRSRFKNTYDKVNEDLKMLFPKVFGGGSAYLELTDDDLLETGVTIMARPPGKKNSTIHLLSGGEKALTALSLVFAIFRLNPAPFCLLDEVDAPLDDANVGRFCKLVSEMSKSVQFIYITHNKIAMEMATHLTGVTMAEPGVSRMVAVDVDEAMAFAEA
ncbi:chromosome segregation protein SMC [Aestuariibacter halophilus]|uniref:Chromosome partition protein Smc n=1 Tax=Fluctibacter halophilus TaxID=226011 RepID=A0ABS8G5F7_9ALTE|nr:chromosome segregation protein SMC [Aestuariibacter halophilus]MCC2615336.1 chromosome segregation protein SMC [Aestuariibacter halophilus]